MLKLGQDSAALPKTLCATASHPEHPRHKVFALEGLTDVEVGTRLEKLENFLPLSLGEFDV